MQRQLLAISAFLLSFLSVAHAQQPTATIKPSLKYGKPAREELTMTAYMPDTAATAVVLYSKTDVRYDLVNNQFCVVYDYEVKIKVLKSEGTSYANISIPYYNRESGGGTTRENISSLDASAYNMEDGKLVRTKMKRDLVFTERLNKSYMVMKFSIPAVREGTVFEYKYNLYSDLFWRIEPFHAQRDIPVLHTQYDIVIPEYYVFSLETRGGNLKAKDEQVNLNYTLHYNGQMERLNCLGRHLSFTGEQLPALRTDSYVWYPQDFMAGAFFELKGENFPQQPYKSFTQDWKDIDELLRKDDDFGSLLKIRNPYRDEMAALKPLLDGLSNNEEKATALFAYLKKKISWNGEYRLYGTGMRKAIKEGTGSNADINFVLMSMLRDAKIPCYPVVMSCRNRGMLPVTHPSLDKLNTFVVAIADTDSTLAFIDGSVSNGALNLLPPVLMVEKGRLLRGNSEGQFLDLSRLGRNQVRSSIQAQLHPDGKVTGSRQCSYEGQYAANLRRDYRAAKDSADFVKQIETDRHVRVTDYHTEFMASFTNRVKESFNFEKQESVNGDFIYINPLLFTQLTQCPFKQSERKLPIEMPYAEQYTMAIRLALPEGYAVEELPQPMTVSTEDRKGICRYLIRQEGHDVVATYSFTFTNLFYLSTDYAGVKKFWEMVAEKNNEMMVIKKL
ncbi:MAG: DUF3857 domain-containing protein [Mediterranea sp.]|jgi:hypothetical protein|nr:DUF3857 domain-containing protein [Mediterranea sp.]